MSGTVFEVAKGSNAITTLASFNGTNGYDPQAGLVLDSQGNLYGTTAQEEPAVNRTRRRYGFRDRQGIEYHH